MTIRSAAAGILRGVIFDLGGTLIRPDRFEEENVAHLLRWAAGRGLPAGPETIRIIEEAREWMWSQTFATGRQYTAREAIARGAERLGWPSDPAFLDQATLMFFEPEVAMARLYPDAQAAVGDLQALGLRLGLVSVASDHALVEAILERVGLAGRFDPVVSSAGFGRIKPDPAIFRFVLDRWGYPAQACVMVGDRLEADVAGAVAVGMRAILVTMDPHPGNAAVADRIRPDAAAGSLGEVVQIIRRWMGLVPSPGPG